MRDLLLWRLLHQWTLPAAEATPLLRQLADRPLAERVPFLGLLPRALNHPDAELRAAAVAALHGASGGPALKLMIEALHDLDPAVRLAAAGALRGSLSGADRDRWAHVMFHPDPAVRREAVAEGKSFPPNDWYALFLVPDPVHGSRAERHLADLTLPSEAVPIVFDYLLRGLIDHGSARRLLARMAWADCLAGFEGAPARDDGQIDDVSLLARVGSEGVWPPPSTDALDELFGLFTEAGTETEPATTAFFDQLAEAMFGQGDFRRRVLASLVATAIGRGSWHPRAAELAVLFDGDFLDKYPWVPVEVRRRSLAALYRAGDRCWRRQPEQVRALVEGDLCRDADGKLDLWAVGAVLHLLPDQPYRHLLDWLGLPRVIDAFLGDLERSAALLGLADNSDRGRKFLIQQLCIQPLAKRARLMALLVRAVSADGLDFLHALDGRAAVQVFEQIATLSRPPHKPLSENKVRVVARELAPRIGAGHLAEFLRVWLAQPSPEQSPPGLTLLGRLVRDLDATRIIDLARRFDPADLHRFLTVVTCCAGFPYRHEVALARALADHPDAEVRAWAVPRRPAPPRPSAPRGYGDPPQLKVGLCALLSREEARPDAERCAALLASHDPAADVAIQFVRFAGDDPAFEQQIDVEMVRCWPHEPRLPLLGNVWLYRWDTNLAALEGQIEAWPGGLTEAVRFAAALGSALLRRRFWLALGRLADVWKWRKSARSAAVRGEALAEALLAALPGPEGEPAARLLVQLRDRAPSDVLWESVKSRAIRHGPALSETVRNALGDWIDFRGLPVPTPAGSASVPDDPPRDGVLIRVNACDDPDALAAWCDAADPEVAGAAAHRLLAHGEAGAALLADRLRRSPTPPALDAIAWTAVRWPVGPALQSARDLIRDAAVDPRTRYRVGTALLTRGETDIAPALVEVACGSGPFDWLTDADRVELKQHTEADWALVGRLAASPVPDLHVWAVERLLEPDAPFEDARQGLLAFVEAGTKRMREQRIRAARWLYAHGERKAVWPLIFQEQTGSEPAEPDLLAGESWTLVEAATAAILLAGQGSDAEEMLLALLQGGRVDDFARNEAYAQILMHASSDDVRKQARERMRPSLSRAFRLRRVAETFAWGVRIGRELTGKLFRLEMISGEKLGYTRFTENKLYITPLPILRGDLHGREVVRALILHEFGHHLYHRGEEALEVWKQADEEKLHPLLNLVSDEHLERNLRAKDRRFGDQLKRLAAYAFQHTAKQYPVESLLRAMRGRAFEILTTTHLVYARREGCVGIESGRILQAMERAGLSFARFVRALRMGLGNRFDDPKVEQGLALFRDRFRHSDTSRLLDIARELRKIFGGECELLNSFDQDDALECDAAELEGEGEGITDAEVQSEMQKVLQSRAGGRRKDRPHSVGGKGLNLGADEHFDLIAKVEPIAYDPAVHAEYARQVARPARTMRRYLERLGLALEPQRFRLSGKSLDRTRIRALVLRGDPRMLVARTLKVQTDLFLGVVIDCSGSMEHNGNIEKAKLFGTLLAEAAKGMAGVDVRLFGFTDAVIYDAGRAERCAVHGLEAGGGNNDAAGLWHAAQVARASHRKAKLLVMISDGSPTECTVAALRGLVHKFTHQFRMCCAQVAVCPLDHVCFPNDILLDEANPEESVRQFGRVMAKLVHKALGG